MSRNSARTQPLSGVTLSRTFERHDQQITRFAWSPDGSKLATPSFDTTIRIWDREAGTFLELEGHSDVVTGVSWSPDGTKLASSADDPSVRIWDAETGACRAIFSQPAIVTGVAWSPKESKLASSSDDCVVRIWDVAGGKLLHELKEHTDRVLSVAWSPDGDLLASASWDGSIRLWDANGQPYGRPYSRNKKRFYQLAWSSDGRIAAACTDGTVSIWDGKSGKRLPSLPTKHKGAIFGLAFSPDGKFLATKAGDNTLRLWRSDTWEFVEFQSDAQWPYSSVLFHPTLPILTTGSDDERAIDVLDLDFDLIFPKRVAQPTPSRDDINILHLSDVHIGNSNPIRHNIQLTSDLMVNLKIRRLHYLVVSGDFTDAATQEEYDKAAQLIELIASRFEVSKDRIILAPGNHDVNWDSADAAYQFKFKRNIKDDVTDTDGRYIKAGDIGFLVRDEELYKKRFDEFRAFYEHVCSQPYPSEYADQAILHTFDDDRVLFLTLNSSWQIDSYYKSRYSINMDALSKALDLVLNSKYDGWLKIGAWHHPVSGKDGMDTAFLEQLATNDFHIVLHGHIHRTLEEYHKYDRLRGIQIIGAGTFGAPPSQMVSGVPLSYNVMVLNAEKRIITVHTRKKEEPEGAWDAYARWGDRNNPQPRYSVDLK